MSLVFISGNHPRHRYIAECLASTGKLVAWVVEVREEFVPSPPQGLSKELARLFSRHFELRQEVEHDFFSNNGIKTEIPVYEVTLDALNADATADFVRKHLPDVVLSYGCHKLSSKFMEQVSCKFWNTHGGLSPDYRGVITHFWPSYFLEPQMTGMTLHETTNFLDGGSVLFQTASAMTRGDNLHMLAARNVSDYANALSHRLMNLDFNSLPQGLPQKTYGKVFMASDWRAEHLSLIYNTYEDKIVDAVLDGTIIGRQPKLVDVF